MRPKLKLPPHWVFSALADMRQVVSRMVVEGQHGDSTKRTHLLWMLDRVNPEQMSATKANRWLGWIQACAVVSGAATLDEMKNLNKQASARSKGEAAK